MLKNSGGGPRRLAERKFESSWSCRSCMLFRRMFWGSRINSSENKWKLR